MELTFPVVSPSVGSRAVITSCSQPDRLMAKPVASRWLIAWHTTAPPRHHRQVFVDDHRRRAAPRCSVAAIIASRSQRGQHLPPISQPPVTFDPLTPIPCLHLGRRPPVACLTACLPTTTTSCVDETALPTSCAPVERSTSKTSHETYPSARKCHVQHTSFRRLPSEVTGEALASFWLA
jgi:hypothetical protein